jgi:hypothetical protein
VNIKINGVQYTDIIDFSDALTELINAQNEWFKFYSARAKF